MMKKLLPILLLTVLTLSACHTQRQALPANPVTLHNTDSVTTTYIETIRIDTVKVTVPIPAESVRQEVLDTVSYLETSLAWSKAWITDGVLIHQLTNKPQPLEAEVPVPVKDTRFERDAAATKEVPVPYPEPVYIERPLSTWDAIRLKSFWYLLVIATALSAYTLRRPLATLLKTLR